MRRLLVIFTAVIFVASAASLAFAEVQNIKVSGDIEITGVARDGFGLGVASLGDDNISLIQSVTRVRIDADLTDNVSSTIRLLNERDWDAEAADGSGDTTDIDLDLAYVTLKEMLYSPLTLTLGRQNLRFGNAMIIGDPDTNNQTAAGAIANADLSARKAFDAMRATLDYDPLTVDLIYSKIDENIKLGTVALDEQDDITLYGINAAYELGGSYDTLIEAYFFAKVDDNAKSGQNRAEKIYCPGARVSLSPIDNLILQGELAYQFGNKNKVLDSNGTALVDAENRQRDAMAAQAVAIYNFDMEYSPALAVTYSWASGDKKPGDTSSTSDYTAWDPMFEDQTLGHIANTMFDNSNCHIVKVEGSLEPMDDVKASLAWIGAWTDKKVYSATDQFFMRRPGSSSLVEPTLVIGKKHICDEVDLTLAYDYTEDVQFKLLGAWLEPGKMFADENSDAATELIASCKVLF